MYGDLEGTYVIDLTYTGNILDPYNYAMTGTETFQGTLMGRRVSYRAEMVGSGIFTIPPPTGFTGSESWVSTIVSADSPLSHLRRISQAVTAFCQGSAPFGSFATLIATSVPPSADPDHQEASRSPLQSSVIVDEWHRGPYSPRSKTPCPS